MQKTKMMNKRAFSRVTFLIVVLCIAFVGLIVYLKFDVLQRLIIGDTAMMTEQSLQIGQEMECS